jgi:DNA polymerase III subunit alpha
MADRSFVHLHCHSHYSLLDGANRIPELVERVKKLGMNSIALTDHGNLFGAIEFYQECKSAGINPVVGYEAYVAPRNRRDREARRRGEAGFHLTLLAQNRTGMQNLIRLASRAYLEGYHYIPRIDKELLSEYKEGLICLSGCLSAEFSDFILKGQISEATDLAKWFHTLFGENFYVEIQSNGVDVQKACTEAAIDIADKLGLPLVATNDAHYLSREDSSAHDVLLCINTGKLLTDENRLKYASDQFFVRSPEEMYALFPDRPDAVARSQEIANKVDIELDFKKRFFPVFEPPGGKKPEEYLREMCAEGLNSRYNGNPPQASIDRLALELDIICRMGFATYFLVVWDFVRFANEERIPASARGSACGALVSYVLKLSHVDPLEYDLLFERFLDPKRSEAPDIDIDFCQDRREEVIAYVRRKYGEQSVAQIGTFGTMAARAAIKDVGRVLNIPLHRVIQLTEMIPKTLGITLDEALQQNPEMRKEYESDNEVRRLLDIARRLEGTNRNAGTHAAGVVISNGPLTDYVPLQRVIRKGADAGSHTDEPVVTTQWVMGDIEKSGLLKMDFLGLRTLTVIDNALRMIERTRGQKLDLSKLPLTDPKTYALLQRGDAKGVFQFESDGIRELLKRMKPDNIRDLIACNALYRPGPLGGGMVDAYVNRKHGREKPAYQHKIMEEILGETYGVMVYQEQVMRILNRLGGIELSSAYACIKAISKKKTEIIDARRAEFIKGAGQQGVAEPVAREIFDLITFFGGYGFNKSHSAAYAVLGYQTAYLKAHYTAEFMAALLSSEIDDGNKRDIMVQHIEDTRRLGVEVCPPDVNEGEEGFAVSGSRVLFGLTAIKGVGRAAASEIVRARREGGIFKDLFDFCERIDLKIVPKAAIERLIKAGAFDNFGAARSQWMHMLPRALQGAGDLQDDKRSGQRNFLDVFETAAPATSSARHTLPDIPEWSSNEKLKYEKEALDFYLSSHPLAEHERELRRFSSHSTETCLQLSGNQEVTLGGMLTEVRFLNTKKARNGNTRYVRCKLEDFTGQMECVMWPDDLARGKDEFVDDRITLVRGTIDRTQDRPLVVINRLITLEQARVELTRGLWLRLREDANALTNIDHLARLLKRAPGPCPVTLVISDTGGRRCRLKLGQDFRVDPTRLPVDELEMLVGAGGIEFHGGNNGR